MRGRARCRSRPGALLGFVANSKPNRGRLLSTEFLRLPSKRQYAHYYTVIKKPVSLDEIKTQLSAGEYTSIEAVKHDFDTCFRNAKRYNMKDSQIWLDAKALHVRFCFAAHCLVTLTVQVALVESHG